MGFQRHSAGPFQSMSADGILLCDSDTTLQLRDVRGSIDRKAFTIQAAAKDARQDVHRRAIQLVVVLEADAHLHSPYKAVLRSTLPVPDVGCTCT